MAFVIVLFKITKILRQVSIMSINMYTYKTVCLYVCISLSILTLHFEMPWPNLMTFFMVFRFDLWKVLDWSGWSEINFIIPFMVSIRLTWRSLLFFVILLHYYHSFKSKLICVNENSRLTVSLFNYCLWKNTVPWLEQMNGGGGQVDRGEQVWWVSTVKLP